jgi:hypothetical protein
MKIAIYGDSYGCHKIDNVPGDTIDRGFSWPELLSKDNQVTNFSLGASSLFYSYQHFIKHHQDFDYNIFLVTQLHRLLVPRNYHGEVYKHIVPEKYKDEMNDDDYRDDAFLENQEHDIIFHNLMVDNIRRLNPNTLLIPTFPSSLDNAPGKSLFDIYIFEQENIPMANELFSNYFPVNKTLTDGISEYYYEDYKKCHLNKDNNIILYNKIINAINNKEEILNIDINDFKKPDMPFDYYFVKSYRKMLNGHPLINDRRLTKEDMYKYLHTKLTDYN